jgi:hypothetical protein
MPTVTIQEAQNRLSDLVHGLTPGDAVVITTLPNAAVPRRDHLPSWISGSPRGGGRPSPPAARVLE